MDLNWAKKEKSLKSLVDLGVKGFYPLFHPDWAATMNFTNKKALTKKEKKKAKDIMNRLLNHRGLERKKIILFSLPEFEREIFVRSFLDMVEGKILDRKPELQ